MTPPPRFDALPHIGRMNRLDASRCACCIRRTNCREQVWGGPSPMGSEDNWTSRSHRTAVRIGTAILAGEHPPGAPLHKEADLAAELDVSRNTLREAMKILASKSLVEVSPRRGTTVLPRERWNVLDPDVLDWSTTGLRDGSDLLEELLDTRAVIEPAAAEGAARHGTPADKARIRAAWEVMQSYADSDDIPAKVAVDLDWHIAVASASHNRFLVSIMGSIAHVLGEHLRHLNDREGNYEGNLANHRRVTEAIEASDAATARATMVLLVAQARSDTRRL
ncbi:FadR family transcriptional regulator [Rhodobacteraceae bacterium CCMM004]|nr:FadR family transcriptional regulator [Rhodobacteraceae bacterium CCMM004]